jgi:uncharacterized repeat protein (TIGR01451 family)
MKLAVSLGIAGVAAALVTAAAGLSVVTSQGSCTTDGMLSVECLLGNLLPGQSATVTIVAQPTEAGLLSNSVSVDSDTDDSDPFNNHDSEETTVVEENQEDTPADLEVIKTDSVDPAIVGQSMSYTVKVKNHGPNTALDVHLVDYLPAGFQDTGVTTTQGICASLFGTIDCDLGNIGVGQTVTITITGIPWTIGLNTNTATVVCVGTHDPNPGNNTDTETTLVRTKKADLSVVKSDSPDPVTVGQNLTYTIVVTNNGPDTAENVTLDDLLSHPVN